MITSSVDPGGRGSTIAVEGIDIYFNFHVKR